VAQLQSTGLDGWAVLEQRVCLPPKDIPAYVTTISGALAHDTPFWRAWPQFTPPPPPHAQPQLPLPHPLLPPHHSSSLTFTEPQWLLRRLPYPSWSGTIGQVAIPPAAV
jgi:hypothetical protein